MTEPVEYRPCLQGFSKAMAEAVAALQERFTNRPVDDTAKETAAFIESLKTIYQRNVKTFFEKDEDPILSRELGVIYGSLVTHLRASFAQWAVYHSSNNELVNKAVMSEECGLSAMRIGMRHSDMAADVVAQLMRNEASVRGKAELLAQSLYQHCLRHHVTYYYYPNSSREYSGHTPLCMTVAKQTRRSVQLHFDYWDGVDMCFCGVGLLFDTPELRAVLQRLADTAFGGPVKFNAAFDTIEVPEPVITR